MGKGKTVGVKKIIELFQGTNFCNRASERITEPWARMVIHDPYNGCWIASDCWKSHCHGSLSTGKLHALRAKKVMHLRTRIGSKVLLMLQESEEIHCSVRSCWELQMDKILGRPLITRAGVGPGCKKNIVSSILAMRNYGVDLRPFEFRRSRPTISFSFKIPQKLTYMGPLG